MKDIIINPDIHGRSFWKESLPKINLEDYEQVVFLGDYLDPYPWEDITRKQAIDNLEEIMEFKRANMDKVTLLIGNHDFQYVEPSVGCSRMDKNNRRDIKSLFISNRRLFQLGYTFEDGTERISFTHAPILLSWINEVNKHVKVLPDGVKNIINTLNDRWLSSDIYSLPILGGLLSFSSGIRGGYDITSSPIWADIREFKNTDVPIGWYQIFGHTQLKDEPIIRAYGADLDCRRTFLLSEVIKARDLNEEET